MKNWSSAPLGDLLKKRSEWITLDPETSYKQATVRLWGKGVALRSIVKGAEIAALSQLRIRQGDFIMSRIDARHGAFGLVPQEMEGAVVSQDFPVFDVCEDRLLPAFLNWMSKTPFFIELCKSASEGTTNRVRLKEDRFFSKAIPLPPLAEQRRMVAQLDAVSEKSTQARRLLAEVDDDLLQIMRSIIWRSVENRGRLMQCREFMRRRRCDVAVEPETEYAFAGVYSFGRGVFRSGTKLGSQFSYRELTRLRTDDFVYPKLMAWEGALGVVPLECDGRVVSPEFPVFEIDRAIADPVVIDTFSATRVCGLGCNPAVLVQIFGANA
jgi:type I restriction enzyme S subunit